MGNMPAGGVEQHIGAFKGGLVFFRQMAMLEEYVRAVG